MREENRPKQLLCLLLCLAMLLGLMVFPPVLAAGETGGFTVTLKNTAGEENTYVYEFDMNTATGGVATASSVGETVDFSGVFQDGENVEAIIKPSDGTVLNATLQTSTYAPQIGKVETPSQSGNSSWMQSTTPWSGEIELLSVLEKVYGMVNATVNGVSADVKFEIPGFQNYRSPYSIALNQTPLDVINTSADSNPSWGVTAHLLNEPIAQITARKTAGDGGTTALACVEALPSESTSGSHTFTFKDSSSVLPDLSLTVQYDNLSVVVDDADKTTLLKPNTTADAPYYLAQIDVSVPTVQLKVMRDGASYTAVSAQDGNTSIGTETDGVIPITFNTPGTHIVDIDASANGSAARLEFNYKEPPPTLEINGADVEVTENPNAGTASGQAEYIASATVTEPTVTTALMYHGEQVPTLGQVPPAEPKLTISGSGPDKVPPFTVQMPSEGIYKLKYGVDDPDAVGDTENGILELTLTYRKPAVDPPPVDPPPVDPPVNPPSDGGGGGDAEPPVNVTNEKNDPDATSDTILVPANTTEFQGKSSTVVTNRETDALVELMQKHADDLPDGEKVAMIQIQDKGAEVGEYELRLPAQNVKKLLENDMDVLSIRCTAGEFRVRNDELNTLSTAESLTIHIKKEEYNGRPAVDVSMESGKQEITQMDNNTYLIEIRIPYTPKEGEDVNAIVIEYITQSGETVLITESVYHPEGGYVSFFTNHLSKYGVNYNPQVFPDVKANHWASSYITYLASRKVINGMGDGKFHPDDKVSRAEFITMMTKAFSAAALGKKTFPSYSDVNTQQWYAKAVGWSYLNNISPVIAQNGKFYPESNLMRQDMATLCNNISLSLSLRLTQTGKAQTFSDGGTIVAYAKQPVSRMTSCGIISGAGGKFFPTNGLTRAESAKIISTLMSKMR